MSRSRRLIVLGVSGAATGSLYALNSWDYPTLLLVVVAGTWVSLRGLERRDQVAGIATVVLASVVAWFPFYLAFSAPVGSASADLPVYLEDVPLVSTLLGTIAAVRGQRTSVGEFLTVFGLPYVAALVLIGSGLIRDLSRRDASQAPDCGSTPGDPVRAWGPVLAAVVIFGLILPAPVLILCGVPLVCAVAHLASRTELGSRTLATALFALGFALIIGTEFFYIQDLFADRMNTIFKVYYQVWTLFAIGTAVGFVAVVQAARSTAWVRPSAVGVVVLGVVLGLAYPAVAYYQWTGHFAEWRTVDGLAYVGNADPDELLAIQWLEDHSDSGDVVLEAAGCSYGNSYRDGVRHNRVSAFTGLPTVIGWGGHEGQWRNGQPEAEQIAERQSDVRDMYADPQSPLFDRYDVKYLYVGTLEREGSSGCRTLEEPYSGVTSASYPGTGWQRVFVSGDVAIYQRDGGSAATVP